MDEMISRSVKRTLTFKKNDVLFSVELRMEIPIERKCTGYADYFDMLYKEALAELHCS